MKIIILKEQHDIIYLDASTPEKMDRVCLSILKVRSSTPEYKEWVEDIKEPQPPPLSFKVSQSLPSGIVRDVALAEWAEYHRLQECYESTKYEVEQTKRAIETNNGKLAYKILYDHRHRENESFEVKEVQEEYHLTR